MSAVPTHFDRHGEPVFTPIASPGRGWTRCGECGRTGIGASWVDAAGQVVDEPDNPRLENGAAVADGARLTTSPCTVCGGRGWFAPRPKVAPKVRPARDWDPCESCDRRGGFWTEAEDGPGHPDHPGWEWSTCDDCSALRPDDNGVWKAVASTRDGGWPDGLGWHPPEVGTDDDQIEQRIAAQTRLYGDQLVPVPPH